MSPASSPCAAVLIESDPARYGTLNATTLANDYMVILTCAVALVEIHHHTWPIRHGTDMVKRLVVPTGRVFSGPLSGRPVCLIERSNHHDATR
jgi:hypothetical protein